MNYTNLPFTFLIGHGHNGYMAYDDVGLLSQLYMHDLRLKACLAIVTCCSILCQAALAMLLHAFGTVELRFMVQQLQILIV